MPQLSWTQQQHGSQTQGRAYNVRTNVGVARAQQFAEGRIPSRKAKPGTKARPQQADIVALENELSATLGAKVAIAHGRGNKGRLVIHYTDLDTLDGLLERLRR